MSNHSWRHLFVSRDTELGWLKAAWRDAKSGHPQLLVLLGESGLGKTRLVQEFYRWLSRAEDPGTPDAPEGYWPDAFISDTTSLDVNPAFPGHPEGKVPPIPWLWWGLRWIKPEGRNTVANGCALIDYRATLDPHVRSIFARRDLDQLRKDAGWKAASLVGTVVEKFTPLGWLTAGRDIVTLVKDDFRVHARLKSELNASPAQHAETDRRDLEEQVLGTFRMILDPANKKAPTVPVILFLDDAQWADETTLRFVLKLLQAARRGNWKLLVIATHWEKEWHEHHADFPSSPDHPTQLADLREMIISEGINAPVLRLERVSDLSEVVTAALSGATAAQRQLILGKAGGNPLLLEEILRHLLDHSQFFEGRDLARTLTKKAERDISERSYEYHHLVDERFCRLDEHVRRALGWSSVQGVHFLARITEAIAVRVAPEYDPTRLRQALESAENPQSLVQLFRDAGKFNRGEFRQAAFQEVARKNLGYDELELEAVEVALRDFLTNWLSGDIGRDSEQFEPAEERDALAMARRVSSPHRPQTRGLWVAATARLAILNASEYLWKQAHVLARELADTTSDLGAFGLSELSFREQYEIIRLLLQLRDLERARRWSVALVKINDNGGDQPKNIDFFNTPMALEILGDIEFAAGNYDSALTTYRRALEVHDSVEIRMQGDSPQIFPNVAAMSTLIRIGKTHSILGDHPSALEAYERGLELSEKAVAWFGETVEGLRGVSQMLGVTGGLERACGNPNSAVVFYRRAIEISERILANFGETSEVLDDASVGLNNLGHIESDLGEYNSAITYFLRALDIRERLLSDTGETPRTLSELATSLHNVGWMEFNQGSYATARARYLRETEVRELLILEFGETPEALLALSAAFGSVGVAEHFLGNSDGALAAYGRSLDICEREVVEKGETPELLSDIMESCINIALESGTCEATRHLLKARDLNEQIIAHGWGTPQTRAVRERIERLLSKLEENNN